MVYSSCSWYFCRGGVGGGDVGVRCVNIFFCGFLLLLLLLLIINLFYLLFILFSLFCLLLFIY